MGTIPDAIDHGPVLSVLIHHLLSEKTSLPLLFPIFLVGVPPFLQPLSPAGELMGLTYVRTNCFSPTKDAFTSPKSH
ncbi:hypothetical protein CEXT_634161 [Caerostris extrusa]|uniref:Uncharacterized protein n=1 Tax=Caerostris extrusa TaxID=172846 RepID=A0AAV4RGK7_CAEEX|nr:hypothetical protein CEXT_634161 [Caerostris extrusa]